ncbi:snRNA-activating protein of 50kDa MW C terminal-domain-containing protein [Crassisporium funariophilum]|nr:snRNA-activating protein of 50kDa MW C terminal-domain-containing protein [Crassisporium funariophilum]
MHSSFSDIRDPLHHLFSHPTLSAHLIKDHEHTIAALHASVNPKLFKTGRKAHLPDPDTLPVEVANIQRSLDSISLSSWRLHTDAVTFMRTAKNSDHNILERMKTSASSGPEIEMRQAVLTISIYNRVTWGPSYVSRSSQHALLSSQTLKDLYNAIPCVSNHLPPEAGSSDRTCDSADCESGCLICIEGLAYGVGEGQEDYAHKLVSQIDDMTHKSRPNVTKATTSLQNTTFSSLSLRINEPYWLIHRGNCEHFLVVDQIRLAHPSDPLSSYPLTLQITPALLDLCRACTKVPAVWSIVGDVRLGENPCVLCEPCWRNMGESEEDEVAVFPIANYACAY